MQLELQLWTRTDTGGHRWTPRPHPLSSMPKWAIQATYDMAYADNRKRDRQGRFK